MIINHQKKRPAAALLLTLLLSLSLVFTACGSSQDVPDVGNEPEVSSTYVVEHSGKTYVSAEAFAALYDIRSYLNNADKTVAVVDADNELTLIISPSASLASTGSVLINEATGEVTDNLSWTYKVFNNLVHLPVAALEEVFGKDQWEADLEELTDTKIDNYFASIGTITNLDIANLYADLDKYFNGNQSRLFTSLRNYENAKYAQFEGTIAGEYVDVYCEREYMGSEVREYIDLYDEDYNQYTGVRIYQQGSNPSGSVLLSMADGSDGRVEDLDSNGFHPYNSVSKLGIDGIKKYWNWEVERLEDPQEAVAAFRITKIGDEKTDIEIHLNRNTDKIVHVVDHVEHNGEAVARDLDIFY